MSRSKSLHDKTLLDFDVVNVGAIWAKELLPLQQGSESLQQEHSNAVRSWCKSQGIEDGHLYSELSHGAAHQYTNPDSYNTDAIKPLPRRYSPEIQRLYAKLNAAQTHDEKQTVIIEYAQGLDRANINYWVPGDSCQVMAPWARDLAAAWAPTGNWYATYRPEHAFAIDVRARRIFDPVWNPPNIDDFRRMMKAAEPFMPEMA